MYRKQEVAKMADWSKCSAIESVPGKVNANVATVLQVYCVSQDM